MNKRILIIASVCLSGWANATLVLDISNMVTNGTAQITGSGLVDGTTGFSVDVTMDGQGNNEIIGYPGGFGFGIDGGNTDALDSNEILSFTFSKDVQLDMAKTSGFSAGEAFAWWIDSGAKTIVATGERKTFFTDLTLDAGQVFHFQAYEDGVTYTDSRMYLTSLDVTVIPEPATLGMVAGSGLMLLLLRRLKI